MSKDWEMNEMETHDVKHTRTHTQEKRKEKERTSAGLIWRSLTSNFLTEIYLTALKQKLSGMECRHLLQLLFLPIEFDTLINWFHALPMPSLNTPVYPIEYHRRTLILPFTQRYF